MEEDFRVDGNWEMVNMKQIQIGPNKTIVIEHTVRFTYVKLMKDRRIVREHWLHRLTMEEIDAQLDDIVQLMIANN